MVVDLSRALAVTRGTRLGEGIAVIGGVFGGLALIWGLTLGIGAWMLGHAWSWTAFGAAAGGAVMVAAILPGLLREDTTQGEENR